MADVSRELEKNKGIVVHKHVKIGQSPNIGSFVELGLNDMSLEIGDDAVIRSGSVIYGNVKIGHHFRSGHHILIREKTIIGDNVQIGTNSIVDGNCVIGDHVNIQSNVYVTWGMRIEDGVFMGPCSVTINDKIPPATNRSLLQASILRKKCVIGAGVIILPGIEIGENSLIGAGSVVTKNIPKNVIAYGNPCRVQKSRE
ncbi:MAG: acyltransferase [Candidatus Heimdallarchaeota archaeon]